MKKIIGVSGAGKSVLSREMTQELQLSIYHLPPFRQDKISRPGIPDYFQEKLFDKDDMKCLKFV